MKVFIVYAHAEPKSFNGALFQTAQDTLCAAGHTVMTSDLYAVKFDPVSGRRNFTTVKNPEFFKQQIEEMHAIPQWRSDDHRQLNISEPP